jgi:hypothetical protein
MLCQTGEPPGRPGCSLFAGNWHVGSRPTRDYVRDRVLLGPEGRYRIHVQGAERRDE